MTEQHRGASFVNSCVKVPLDPYSRQPTPAYERPTADKLLVESVGFDARTGEVMPCGRINSRMDNKLLDDLLSAREERDLLEYMESMGALYDEPESQHLSNEQFKQKLDHLKRRQRLLLKNLRNCLEQADDDDDNSEQHCPSSLASSCQREATKSEETTARASSALANKSELALKGKRCNLELHSSRAGSPLLWASGSFSCLAEDQDLLTYRRNPELCRYKEREKAAKTLRNEKILSSSLWSSSASSESKSPESDDPEVKVETTSLPPRSPTRGWQPTVTKPFNFTLREGTEKYLNDVEQQEYGTSSKNPCSKSKNNPAKKRRIRPVPLTSKIPLYDKLMAEKEERSRIVREESALSLLSQVRPFKLECERRAHRALTRSSPELSSKRLLRGSTRFKAKPVPRNLFSTDVYDRMLEEEYFRNLQKRVRASELLKSASLPPSMAKRERCRSASCPRSSPNDHHQQQQQQQRSSSSDERSRSCSSIGLNRGTPLVSERCSRNSMSMPQPAHGTNLAAILRAQASREKLEREIQDRLEEKRREQMLRLRKSLIGRKPAWRALRFAARHEHERDLDFRASLRRDEAREQAERHRLQMELMLDRVTRIPTLFERYSQLEDEALLQSFQSAMQLRSKLQGPKKSYPKRFSSLGSRRQQQQQQQQSSSSTESYISLNSNNSRPSSGSLSSSSSPACLCHSSLSCKSSLDKKKSDRGPLKVSINETAELIEDCQAIDREDDDDDDGEEEESFSVDSATSQVREEREKRVLGGDADTSSAVVESAGVADKE